jgi:hypothetical protein
MLPTTTHDNNVDCPQQVLFESCFYNYIKQSDLFHAFVLLLKHPICFLDDSVIFTRRHQDWMLPSTHQLTCLLCSPMSKSRYPMSYTLQS